MQASHAGIACRHRMQASHAGMQQQQWRSILLANGTS